MDNFLKNVLKYRNEALEKLRDMSSTLNTTAFVHAENRSLSKISSLYISADLNPYKVIVFELRWVACQPR